MSGFVYIWFARHKFAYYIGSHKGDPDDRYVGSGSIFKLAIAKHGIDNFTRKILYQGPFYREVEEYFLRVLKVNNDSASYNIHNYVARPHNWRPVPSKERNKRSGEGIKQAWQRNPKIGMSGKKQSEKSNKKRQEAMTGRIGISRPKGVKMPEDWCKNLSKTLKETYKRTPKKKGRKDTALTRENKKRASELRELEKSLRKYSTGYRPSQPQQKIRYNKIIAMVEAGDIDLNTLGINPASLK